MKASCYWLMKNTNGPGPLDSGPAGKKIPVLRSRGSGTSRHVGVTGRISMWEAALFASQLHVPLAVTRWGHRQFLSVKESAAPFSIKPTCIICPTLKAHSICVSRQTRITPLH